MAKAGPLRAAPGGRAVESPGSKVLRRARTGIAAASTLAGAAVSMLPACVIGLVRLFYDSAGGLLVLLGSLINVLPLAAGAPAGGTAPDLPLFQMLDAPLGSIVLRSVGATCLCVWAFLMVLSGRRLLWAALCCIPAAALGGTATAATLAPTVVAAAAGSVLAGRSGRGAGPHAQAAN